MVSGSEGNSKCTPLPERSNCLYSTTYPGELIRQSDLIESDRIHVGIRLDLMEISIKPTKSWSNLGCGPTFGTLVSD